MTLQESGFSDWREHAGPLGVEPPTREERRKKEQAAEIEKKKTVDHDPFDKASLRVIRDVND